MGYTVEVADDFSTSKFLECEGQFHVICNDATDSPMKADGSMMVGCLEFAFEVLDGNVAGQEGQTVKLKFFEPKLDASDKAKKFIRNKLSRVFLALGLINLNDKGKKVEIELNDAKGRQCVIDVVKSDNNDKFLELNYNKIYHVDDPEVASVPKDADAIKSIPASLRREKKATQKDFSEKVPAAGAATAVDVSDI